ncbi:MAG: VOC family protein [Novosphingobium sp.]
MTQMVFINLPVADLPKAMQFYTAIGFRNEPKFTDDTAAAMQLSDAIVVMLITLPRWATFTDRPLPPAGSSEVMNCLSCDSRETVDRLTEAAKTAGGAADINPSQDHGFMYGRSFTDPDNHVWEVVWMDPAAAPHPQQDQ